MNYEVLSIETASKIGKYEERIKKVIELIYNDWYAKNTIDILSVVSDDIRPKIVRILLGINDK